MNPTLELPGLREDLARDFLAAIGLLRLLDLKWPALQPKLSWHLEKGFPIIHLASALPSDWCEQLVSDIQSLEQHPKSPLFHGEIIKTQSEVFRNAIRDAIDFQQSDHPLASLPERMFAAYGGQIADPKTGDIEATMLSFANNQGGKLLLRDVRELIRAWTPCELEKSIKGEGTPTPGKSFRWAPHEFRSAAYCAQDPSSKIPGNALLDIPSLNILSFFGLSCVPSVDDDKRCSTASFHNDERRWAFYWPIWRVPMEASPIIALLAAPSEITRACSDIARIWRSQRLVTPNKSVYFTPATLA